MKTCFVGIGSIAKRHIKNLFEICKEEGMDICIDALRRKCSNNEESLAYVNNIYTSISELPLDYDIIFITNPTSKHIETLKNLHDRGKHFFIEKPISSLDTINQLENISFRADSVYYIAGPLRYSGVVSYLKSVLDVSKVRSVRCVSSSYLPDWRPGIDYRETYSAHKSLGGGVSIDLIHEWDYLAFLFGMPEDVKSFLGKASDLEIDSEDYAIYIARYKSGMVAELHLDYFGRQAIRKVEIITDNDTIVGDFITGELKYLKTGKRIVFSEERDEMQKRELKHFINLIRSEDVPKYNGIDKAVQILKLTQGIID